MERYKKKFQENGASWEDLIKLVEEKFSKGALCSVYLHQDKSNALCALTDIQDFDTKNNLISFIARQNFISISKHDFKLFNAKKNIIEILGHVALYKINL